MEAKFNILVFPCGSEIGLEIYRSLRFSRHINLVGANSIDDHGTFVYKNYVGNLPFVKSPTFISSLKKVIKEYQIDAVYPTMDYAIQLLKKSESDLGCKVVASPEKTSLICASKRATYKHLKNVVKLPLIFETVDDVREFPVFMKPDVGYGSRGAELINSKEEVLRHLQKFPDAVILENLPGKEFTVDCYSNSKGELLYAQPRLRGRIFKGISVHTYPVKDDKNEFLNFATAINSNLEFNGAWFFQVKESGNGDLTLLEVACRLAGSSSLSRNLGINFALLSVMETFGLPVEIIRNDYFLLLDRALDNKYKLSIDYNQAYIDFDDCLLIDGKVNSTLVSFIFHLINNNKKVILITKHALDIQNTLQKYRIQNLFDEVIHLKKGDDKSAYIKNPGNSIFIDDSFIERKRIHEAFGMPVFAPDAVESLF